VVEQQISNVLLVTHQYLCLMRKKTQQLLSGYSLSCQIIVELDELVIVAWAKNDKLFWQCANSIASHINPED
jgi:hypothetical protein